MTVGVAYRVPGQGAVLVSDGRVTAESGAILTDMDDKTLHSGSWAALCAGTLGGLWVDLKETMPRTRAELRKAVTTAVDDGRELEYELLVFDRRADVLVHMDQLGDELRRGPYATIGCGGAVALGVLDALAPAKSLATAERLCRRAVKAACRRNSACGGKIRTLVVPLGRAPVQVR